MKTLNLTDAEMVDFVERVKLKKLQAMWNSFGDSRMSLCSPAVCVQSPTMVLTVVEEEGEIRMTEWHKCVDWCGLLKPENKMMKMDLNFELLY